jgi:peptidoglycan/xylan/chitin deacetylase (PgdA/CDA1 family)
MSRQHLLRRSRPRHSVIASALAGLFTAAALVMAGSDTRAAMTQTANSPEVESSILVYHRFGPVAVDAMTVRTDTFRAQLDYLSHHGHPVVPLRTVVAHRLGQGAAPPPKSVAITVDDGHKSVFTEMLPIVQERRLPVTLFIYPSAISNAAYAMTWDELDALARTGLFDIQSHTYWHPNFKTERGRLTPDAFRAFVVMQLEKPRTTIRAKLGLEADLIAWPFGIYDDELTAMAREAGYIAGFTLERRSVTARDPLMAMPRFLVSDTATGRAFAAMLPETRP